MKNLVLVKKYAHGLVNALDDEEEFRLVRGDLENLLGVLEAHEPLRGALHNPFLNSKKKAAIIQDVIGQMGCHDKTKRLIGLLADHGRLDILKDLAGMIPEIWNELKGRLTFEVSTALSMNDAQKERLGAELEKLEGKPVRLVYIMDPEILGGLRLKRGNIITDLSVEGDLLKLKEKIQEG
jgi:F-type H+-transporting ATPase subunit delta